MQVSGPARPPTVRLRRLAAELRRARHNAELSRDEVFEQTGVSLATLYRTEKPERRPQRRTLNTLLDLYSIDAKARDRITALWAEAETQGWLQPYHQDLREDYSAYIQFEAEAAALRNWEPVFVPGLLQTADYARAVIEGVLPSATDRDLEPRVRARMERQALLTKPDPLHLTAVMDEATLWREVGGEAVMAGQMSHLLDAAKQEHIEIRVIPNSAGAHPGMPGNFVLMAFPDVQDPELVYIDSMANAVFLESETEVSHYDQVFKTLLDKALGSDDSLNLIADVEHEFTQVQETA